MCRCGFSVPFSGPSNETRDGEGKREKQMSQTDCNWWENPFFSFHKVWCSHHWNERLPCFSFGRFEKYPFLLVWHSDSQGPLSDAMQTLVFVFSPLSDFCCLDTGIWKRTRCIVSLETIWIILSFVAFGQFNYNKPVLFNRIGCTAIAEP